MIKRFSFIFAFVFYLSSIDYAYGVIDAKAVFGRWCGKFQTYEKLFSGDCYLSQEQFPGFLQSVVDKALAYDPAKSVDELFMELLPKMTEFFEKAYSEKYGTNLEKLKDMMNDIGDKLSTSTDNAGMIDLDAAFDQSGIYTAGSELIDENSENTCSQGNLFCGQTADMFSVKNTNDWNTLSVHEVLEKALNNSVTRFNYKDPVADAEFRAINRFLLDLKEKGTAGIQVRALHSVLNTRHFKSIVGTYRDNGFYPTRPTKVTTVKTTKTTTVPQKVINVKAVSEELYISLPLTLFLVAVAATTGYVVYQMFFENGRPTSSPINEEIEFQNNPSANIIADRQSNPNKMANGGNHFPQHQEEPVKAPYMASKAGGEEGRF